MNIEELDDPRSRDLHKLAHEGMEAGKAWHESRKVDAESSDTWLHTQRFSRFLAEYWEARVELEEEERKRFQPPWRNEGE